MIYPSVCRRLLLECFTAVWALGAVMIWLLTCLGDFEHVNDNYQVLDLLWYTLRMMPFHLVRFQAILFVLCALMWFVRMRQAQQLIALQVLGVSRLRLLSWLLPMVLLLVGMVGVLSEGLSPVMALWAKQVRAERASGGQMSQDAAVIWVRTPDGFLRAVLGDSTWNLHGVYHFIVGHHGLSSWSYAPSMDYQASGVWTAKTLHEHNLGSDEPHSLLHDVRMPLHVNPDVVDLSAMRSEYLNLVQLYNGLTKGKSLGLAGSLGWSMWWLRIVQPLHNAALVLTTVAVLFAASAKRSRIYIPLVISVIVVAAGYFTWMEVLRQIPLGLGFLSSLVLVMFPGVITALGYMSVRTIRD